MLHRKNQKEIGDYIQFRDPSGMYNNEIINTKDGILISVKEFEEIENKPIVITIHVDGKTNSVISTAELKITKDEKMNMNWIEFK